MNTGTVTTIAVLENQNAPDAASSKSAPREDLLQDLSEQENPAHEFWCQKEEAKEVFKPFGGMDRTSRFALD